MVGPWQLRKLAKLDASIARRCKWLDKLATRRSSMTRLSRDEHREQERIVVYISLEHDCPHDSCSIHFNYLVIAFIAKTHVISYWSLVRLSLTNLFIKPKPKSSWPLKDSDLTTLNTLRMFTSRQRNLAPSITSVTTSKINNHFVDRVKTNKLDVYKNERDELNDWFIQMKLYFAFNSISKNQKIFFAFTYFKERTQH